MVELGIYSTENGSLILENCACFAECYLFLGCRFGESMYSIAYFLQEEEQEYPGRTRLYCHITTLSSITEWILWFVKEVLFFFIASLLGNATVIRSGTFRPPPLLYRPRGPGKLSSATAKQSNRANSINSEHLFFMILVNLVVLLLCSCLFWVSTLCWLERSNKFDWFDCVRLPNLIEPNRWIKFD